MSAEMWNYIHGKKQKTCGFAQGPSWCLSSHQAEISCWLHATKWKSRYSGRVWWIPLVPNGCWGSCPVLYTQPSMFSILAWSLFTTVEIATKLWRWGGGVALHAAAAACFVSCLSPDETEDVRSKVIPYSKSTFKFKSHIMPASLGYSAHQKKNTPTTHLSIHPRSIKTN